MRNEEIGILVVDDVNTMRIQIKELLKQSGFARIFQASNGEEAKAKLTSGEAIHLALVDWQMNPTNGLDLLKFIRTNEQLRNILFMMVTAEDTRDKVVEALKSGVDSYLLKPLTKAEIDSKVFSVLLKKGLL